MSILYKFTDQESESVSLGSATIMPKADPALDFWLTHHLAQLYGPVVGDPLSDDLLVQLKKCFG